MVAMQKKPFGYRQQVQARRDMHSLSQQGGHGKATHRLARHVIAAKTSSKVQEENACEVKRKRMCGNSEDQVKTAKVMATLLSKREVETMMSSPRLTSTATKTTNVYLQKIGQSIGPYTILETCDCT